MVMQFSLCTDVAVIRRELNVKPKHVTIFVTVRSVLTKSVI